nr:cell adhesion molecule Dscam2-like [Cherax quadricarinatus]
MKSVQNQPIRQGLLETRRSVQISFNKLSKSLSQHGDRKATNQEQAKQSSQSGATSYFAVLSSGAGVSSPAGPVLVEPPPGLLTFTNTSGAVLGCLARGDPPPQVTWLNLDHSPVNNIPGVREVLTNGSLMIWPFSGTDYRQDVHAAVYQCRAANPTGVVLAPPTTLRAGVFKCKKWKTEMRELKLRQLPFSWK